MKRYEEEFKLMLVHKNEQSKIYESYIKIDKVVIKDFYLNYKRYGDDKLSIVLTKQWYDISKYKIIKSIKRQKLIYAWSL